MPFSQPDYTQNRIAHWNQIARTRPAQTFFSREYHRRLREIYRHLVSPHLNVLELGCGRGDLLAALTPARGIGIDFSPAMLQIARQKYPHLVFLEADAHYIELNETFDVIILSDLLNDVYDVQAILENIRPLCRPDTRLILNTYSRLHQPLLSLAGALGLATPLLPQNWLAPEDTENLLRLAGFEVIHHLREILLPLPIPLLP